MCVCVWCVCVCVCVCVCFGRHSTVVRYDEIGCVEDLSVLLLKVSSIPFTFLVFCRVFSVAWGRTSCVPPSRKHISCVPRCLLHEHQLRPDLSTRRLRKCISCVPRALLHCVSYRDTTKPHEQTGKRTCSAARDTTHTHTTHTPHTHTHTHTY